MQASWIQASEYGHAGGIDRETVRLNHHAHGNVAVVINLKAAVGFVDVLNNDRRNGLGRGQRRQKEEGNNHEKKALHNSPQN